MIANNQNAKDSQDKEILKVDALGRVRVPRERREKLLDEFERSGMPGTRFAKRYGINYQTFASWVQKRRHGRGGYKLEKTPAKPGTTSPARPRPTLLLAEISPAQIEPPAQAQTPSAGLRIELPGGTTLVLGHAGQAAIAAALIRHLGHPAAEGTRC